MMPSGSGQPQSYPGMQPMNPGGYPGSGMQPQEKYESQPQGPGAGYPGGLPQGMAPNFSAYAPPQMMQHPGMSGHQGDKGNNGGGGGSMLPLSNGGKFHLNFC
jgi:hypothetical protein